MEKAVLRKSVINQLKQLTFSQHGKVSAAIADRLLETQAFQQAQTIGLTISRFPEVDTHAIIERCWQLGKRVAVPKCDPVKRTMEFRIIDSLDQLETVYMDLQEPAPAKTAAAAAAEIDLLIVPGVVFMESGYRIGFGGGYYDRYLTSYAGTTLSLAFDLQLAPAVPIESHDMPVGGIITESKVIWTKAVER